MQPSGKTKYTVFSFQYSVCRILQYVKVCGGVGGSSVSVSPTERVESQQQSSEHLEKVWVGMMLPVFLTGSILLVYFYRLLE